MTTIGVLGGSWRATVAPYGAIAPWDGAQLDWYVAADDRWHVPADEVAVRQRRIDGTPVVETRLRVPTGDVVQRVFAVADHGGLTLVELENESNLPVAVAFAGSPVLAARPPADTPVRGIDLPAGAQLFPVGHHAVLTVGLSHRGMAATTGGLPLTRPDLAAVVRGWTALTDRAGRLTLPDTAQVEAVTAARCDLLLEGPEPPEDDPVGFLLGVDALVRMSGGAAAWVLDVASAVEAVLRGPRGWEADAALDGAARVLGAAGEDRAVRDVARHRTRWSTGTDRPAMPGSPPADDPARRLAWAEHRLVSGDRLLPLDLPRERLGQPLEVHGLPAATSTVSFALRWHGARPAVLWEREGAPVTLTAPHLAPGWTADAAAGEALWPAPPGAIPAAVAGQDVAPHDPMPLTDAPDVSFG